MYITDLLCISPQQTYNTELFINKLIKNSGNKYLAVEPYYGELIPAATLRRMGKFTRMGVGTGLPLLKKYPNIEGIIIGTASGCVDDSMKFLNQIEQYHEGTLTPTNFIQSTPNALAGLLSMMSNNIGYNNTHVHEGLAFENALLDAQMFLEENNTTILVGAAEEISEWNFNINLLKGRFKQELINSDALIESGTSGTICGEGAAMFVFDASPRFAMAQINDIAQITSENKSDVINMINKMLIKNNLKTTDIDALILGLNGDVREDHFYNDIYRSLFDKRGVFTFKNVIGEYPTASAFAVWLAVNIMRGSEMPSDIIYVNPRTEIKKILIYNHFNALQHSAILVSK